MGTLIFILGLLIATDVAARGLDIPNVEHVVHYQVPRTSEVSFVPKPKNIIIFIQPLKDTALKKNS